MATDTPHRGDTARGAVARRHGRPEPGASSQAALTARAAGLVLLLTAALTVLFLAFSLPAVNSGPHDVPIGVAGPEAATTSLTSSLEQAQPGAFDVTAYPDADTLRAAVLNREIYGGLVPATDGLTVVTASAASPAVAQTLSAVGSRVAAASNLPVTTRDVAPLPPDDPRGAGFAALALPLTLGGMLPAVALGAVLARRPLAQGLTALAFSLVAGLTVAAILRFWFGSLTGDTWAVAGVIALGMAAISLTVLGLQALLGHAGLGLGAALFVLLGTPLSGLTSAPELLPAGWGAAGQLLPPGATGSLLRSTAFFDDAAVGTPLLVMGSWVVAGLLLLAGGAAVQARRARSAPVPTPRTGVHERG
jgi:hypothetical protein